MPYRISYYYPARVFDCYVDGAPAYKTVPQLASMENVPDDRFEELLAQAKAQSVDGKAEHKYIPYTEEEARALRNKLLAETDWTELMDAALTTASKKEFRAYRQNLRNVPQQEGFPANIVWPVKPEAVKADPEPVEDIVDAIIGEEGLE